MRGRPPRPVCAVGVALLRQCGISWRTLERSTGIPVGTLRSKIDRGNLRIGWRPLAVVSQGWMRVAPRSGER